IVKEPVEPTHLVRTVISAITGSHTTVVNHLVLSLTSVHGCSNRTNSFTRSMITVLTHHRLEYYLRVIGCMFHFPKLAERLTQTGHSFFFLDIISEGFFRRIISVNPQPVHISISPHFLFPYHRNVVLSVTGYNTSPT